MQRLGEPRLRPYSKTVLVADDSAVVRTGLADVIGGYPGMAVSGQAANAQTAIELAGEFQPDVALLDMNMPGGGIGAAHGIRSICPQTRMLVLTVRRDKDSLISMLREGVSGYLLKGTRPSRIMSAIGQVMRGRAVLSPELGKHVVKELAIEHDASPIAAGELIRVMAVDDDPAVVEAVGDLITGEPGLQLVGVATNVEDAIALASSRSPDVALIDVRMPDWGGERVAFEVGRVSPTTRVMAFSASDEPEEVEAMLRGGAFGYIVKGYGSQELTRNIQHCARGHVVLEVAADVLHYLVRPPRSDQQGALAGAA